MERKLHRLSKALGIEFSEALEAGMQFYIRLRISDNDKRLTQELLQDFADISFKNAREIETYIRIRKEEQKTLESLAESQINDELIDVWDPDNESYIQIPLRQYNENPTAWVLRSKVKS